MHDINIAAQLAGGLELAQNQRTLEAATNVLHILGLMRIVPGPADRIVEKSDQINDVVVKVLGGRCAPMKHVEQLELEAETVELHDDVIGMKIDVIFPHLEYLLVAARHGWQELHGLKVVESLAGLACEEMAEQRALD